MARRLAAILCYDAVGYSLAMGRDEARTLDGLKSDRLEIIDTNADQLGGRTIKLMGDGALLEFASAVDAVIFAVSMQCTLAERNAKLPEDQQRLYRIGINIGDVMSEGDDIYGDGVNIASRLETLAEPGGICIHQNVREQLRGKLDFDFDDMGEVDAKNIERPIRAFRVALNEKAAAIASRPIGKTSTRKRPTRFWQAVAGIGLALVLVAGVVLWQSSAPDFEPVAPETMAQPLPAKPSIAVLALDDLSAGADADYLSDAISEGIITGLSRFSDLFVIARNSSFKYREKATDVRVIASELGVRYILEGSQQKSGDTLRVTVQLIDAVAGNHIWADTYDRDLADIFAVQDQISSTVAATLGKKLVKIAGEEAKRADPARLRAFEYFLEGLRYFDEYTKEGSEQARLSFLKAVAADPSLSDAHSGLAWTYINGFRWGWTDLDRGEALVRARKEAQIALELAPYNHRSHFTKAVVHMQAGEREQAFAGFEKALELNPNAADVMQNLAEALVYVGRFPEAIALMQKSMRLDPHHPGWYYWNLGWAQYSVGACDEALATMRKWSRVPPLANTTLAGIYICLGDIDKAREAIVALRDTDREFSVAKFRLNLQGKYEDPAILERWIDDLRKAGLPE